MTVISTLELRLASASLDDAYRLLSEVLADTRKRPGALGVEVVIDVEDPAHVTAIERWESIEADDAYRAWRATPEGASGLGSILAAAPVLTRYQLSDV